MIPVPVRGWNPLAGLSAEALRPIQAEAPANLAPVGEAELIGLCERYAELHTEWLTVGDEHADLSPNTPRERVLQFQMDAVMGQSMEIEAELVGRTATTPAGLLALARAALHSMVTDPRDGVLDLQPGLDGSLPICRRPDDDGVLALVLVNSVIEFLGGRAMRFVNIAGAPSSPPPPPAPPQVPAPDDDGELVRLCGEFCVAEERRYTDAPPCDNPAMFDEEAFDDLMESMDEQQEGLLEQIAQHPPTTLNGVRSIARAYRVYVMDDCFNPLTMAIDGRPADASEPQFEDKLLCVLLRAMGHDPELDRRLERHRRVKAGKWIKRD